MLLPIASGTSALHQRVPVAVPDFPVEVVHFTATTAVLSELVPVIRIEAELAERMVVVGYVIRRAGAMGSFGSGLGGVGGVGGVDGGSAGLAGSELP
jgi:hypothetical protein